MENTTKELLPEKDFEQHINKSLQGRRWSLRIIYPLIFSAYLFAAFACFKFPGYFHQISATNTNTKNDKVHKSSTPTDSSSHGKK